MNLSDAKRGDLAIFSNGSQALIEDVHESSMGRFIVSFDTEVTGWINKDTKYCWCYNRDGSFSTSPGDRNIPHLDIVKVVHND